MRGVLARHLARSVSRSTSSTPSHITANGPVLQSGFGQVFLGVCLVTGIVYVVKSQNEKRSRVVLEPSDRKKVVILGSGWAGVNMLSQINTDAYEVTMVSPNNYFLFTPLLPSAVVGTLQLSSITQPARKFYSQVASSRVKFYEASCEQIDVTSKKIKCADRSAIVGELQEFDLDYDYLVLAVGSQPNTFGTPGVEENCYFVKSIEEARRLRNHMLDCVETANLPGQSEEEMRRLLHFVIVGGGPTGVETAAEIQDFIDEDLAKYYPQLAPYMSVSLVQSGDHLLNTYSQVISERTAEAFQDQHIDVIFNSRVTAVTEKTVDVMDKSTKAVRHVPYGTCIWSTGVGQLPLVREFIKGLPEQTNRRAITTDRFLQVKGAPGVFAMGDCASIEQIRMLQKVTELFREADTDGDETLSKEELQAFALKVSDQYPQMKLHAQRIVELFEQYDTNKDNALSLSEFTEMLKDVDRSMTSLPATAQVASQQGKYLADLFNKHLYAESHLEGAKPFDYNHMGSFAYIGGNQSVLDTERGVLSGLVAWVMWRGAYLTKQYSVNNALSIAIDWTKVIFFGRDISRA